MRSAQGPGPSDEGRTPARALFGPGPCLVIAAHPDDEVIGAAGLLRRHPSCSVLHVTDGAPRDRGLWPPGVPPASRAGYARLRAEEAARALALAGLAAPRIHRLGLVDQEVAHELPALATALEGLMARLAPAVVVSPPFEGGHPDHDACAFAARAAVTRLGRRGLAPRLVEMTSYHRWQGTLRTGTFLPGPRPAVRLELTAAERILKRHMLDCFTSQAEVLRPFGVERERFRPAPRYDFSRPPLEVHYESLGWPLRAEAWCRLAVRAREELGV
jgi:LmbE family N-acetylglucosaminyl deacetylase